MRNVFTHVENSGKPRILHPTRCIENKKSEMTWNIFCQKLEQNQSLTKVKEIYNSHDISKDG